MMLLEKGTSMDLTLGVQHGQQDQEAYGRELEKSVDE